MNINTHGKWSVTDGLEGAVMRYMRPPVTLSLDDLEEAARLSQLPVRLGESGRYWELTDNRLQEYTVNTSGGRSVKPVSRGVDVPNEGLTISYGEPSVRLYHDCGLQRFTGVSFSIRQGFRIGSLLPRSVVSPLTPLSELGVDARVVWLTTPFADVWHSLETHAICFLQGEEAGVLERISEHFERQINVASKTG